MRLILQKIINKIRELVVGDGRIREIVNAVVISSELM